MRRAIKFLLFLFCLAPRLQLLAIAHEDTTTVEWRKFDEEKINKYRNDPDYTYERQQTEASNWWQEFWKWLEQFLPEEREYERQGTGWGGLGNIISMVFILAVAGLLVWALTKARFRGFISGKGKRVALEYEVTEENIHEIEYVSELQKAERDRDFRKAVRLRYLETLKTLTDQGWIEWRPNKTNHEYFRELRGTSYIVKFRELTTIFDYVWYGEFNLQEQEYYRCAEDFKKYINGVGTAPPRPQPTNPLMQ